MKKGTLLAVLMAAFAITSCQQQKEVARSQLTPTILSDSILTMMPGDLLLADNHIVWSDPFGKEVFLHVHDMDGKEIGSMGKIGKGPKEFVTPSVRRFCLNNSFVVSSYGTSTKGYLSIDSVIAGKEPFVEISPTEKAVDMMKLEDDVYMKQTKNGEPTYFISKINGHEGTFGEYPVEGIQQHVGGNLSYDKERGLLAFSSFVFPYITLYKKQDDEFKLRAKILPSESTYTIAEGRVNVDRKQKGGGDITICKDYVVVLQRDYATDPTDERTVGRDISKCPRTVFLYNFDLELVRIIELGMPVMRIAAYPNTNRLYVIGANPEYVLASYEL